MQQLAGKLGRELTDQLIDRLLSRSDVAHRWAVSVETVKRRQKEGLLHPIYFNRRLIRYSLGEILNIEQAGLSGRKIASNGGLMPKNEMPLESGEKPETPKVGPVASKKAKAPKVGFVGFPWPPKK